MERLLQSSKWISHIFFLCWLQFCSHPVDSSSIKRILFSNYFCVLSSMCILCCLFIPAHLIPRSPTFSNIPQSKILEQFTDLINTCYYDLNYITKKYLNIFTRVLHTCFKLYTYLFQYLLIQLIFWFDKIFIFWYVSIHVVYPTIQVN